MKSRTLTPMGSLHPILFFVFVYVVALLCSVFICSSLFYSCNASSAKALTEKSRLQQKSETAVTAIVFRK